MAGMSEVLLGRQALAMIGSRTGIESLTENSPEARIVGTWSDTCRTTCLERFDFSFARQTGYLAVHSEAPTNGWAYRYSYPANALAFRRVLPTIQTGTMPPFEVEMVGEEKTILTDEYQAQGQWTVDIQNYALFPGSFLSAVRALLAYHISGPIMGDLGIKLAPTFYQMYDMSIKAAYAADRNTQRARQPLQPKTLQVRG